MCNYIHSGSTSDSKTHACSESESGSKTHTRSESKKGQWFEILDVSPSATVEEIKSAYCAKISGYHPDKVATLAEELRILAEERSKAITMLTRLLCVSGSETVTRAP